MNDVIINGIVNDLGIKKDSVIATLKLLGEGATIPFIARYRKEVTGALDEEQIRSICVFISGFSTVRKKQLSIFDNFNNNENMLDNDKLQSVIDEIRDKYGDKVIGYVSDKDNRR